MGCETMAPYFKTAGLQYDLIEEVDTFLSIRNIPNHRFCLYLSFKNSPRSNCTSGGCKHLLSPNCNTALLTLMVLFYLDYTILTYIRRIVTILMIVKWPIQDGVRPSCQACRKSGHRGMKYRKVPPCGAHVVCSSLYCSPYVAARAVYERSTDRVFDGSY